MSEMENKKETREGKLTQGETLGAIGAIVGSVVVGIGLKAGFDKIKAKIKAKKAEEGGEPKENVITKLKDKIETKKAEKKEQ